MASLLGKTLASRVLGAFLLSAALLAPWSRTAEAQGAGEPAPSISLERAVELTLENDPAIRQALEEARARRGQWTEQSGIFDNRFTLESAYAFDRQELIGNRLRSEIDQRNLLVIAAGALELTGNQLLARLADQEVGDRPVEVRTDCGEFEDRLAVTTADGSFILCRDTLGNVSGLILPPGATGGLDINQLLDDDLTEAIGAGIEQNIAAQIRSTADLVLRTAEALRLQRARLGDVPEVVEQVSVDLRLAYEVRTRSGVTLAPFLTTMGMEDNYAGKPRDPDFGGSPVPGLFTGAAGLEVTIPLGKNRGRQTVTAAERAAEAGFRAAQAQYQHVLSEEVLRTVSAYWRLAAEQRRLRWLETSSLARQELLEAVDVLIEADERLPVDRHRASAQDAEARSDVAAARRDVIAARLALAAEIGTRPESLRDAPLASRELPRNDKAERAQPRALDAWLADLDARRFDLRAAERAQAAAAILREAAQENLRHEVDLSLNASYSVLHESFDQRAWDLEAHFDAWGGDLTGPSYGFRLTWRVPLRNRAARGQLTQAESSLARSRIARDDLERGIRLRVGAAHRALAEARAELRDVGLTVKAQAEVLETSRNLYGAGDLTLLDILLTEEQLISARLAEVAAAERVAQLEAQLRFEAGELFTARLGDEDSALLSWNLSALGPRPDESTDRGDG
ncbi:MAG: TolC family protein [Acidobacteriota bacterium]